MSRSRLRNHILSWLNPEGGMDPETAYFESDDILAEYRRSVDELFISRVNITFLVCIILMPGAIVFDRLIFPDQLTELIRVRFVSTCLYIILWISFYTSRLKKYPRVMIYTLVFLTSGTIAHLCYHTGQWASSYYAGQILVIMGVATIAPMGLIHVAICGLIIMMLHFGWNLGPAIFHGTTFDWPLVWNSLYFQVMTLILMALASWMIENYRRKSFVSTYRYRNMIDRMEDAYYQVDHRGRFTFVNAYAARIMGHTIAELKGKRFTEFLTREQGLKILATADAIGLSGKTQKEVEIHFDYKNGEPKIIETSITPHITASGIIKGYSGIGRDVTDRKQAENLRRAKLRAEEASLAKSRFLAAMSHELRTPLNHILGFNELVLDKHVGSLNDVQEEYLGHVHASSQHLLSLISDILDISKIEAGKMKLKLKPTDLEALLTDCLILCEELAVKKKIQIKRMLSNLPDKGMVDARKLKQIVYNLLSNAVKFTPKNGTIRFEAQALAAENISTVALPPDGNGLFIPPIVDCTFSPNEMILLVSVTDTGVGLKPDQMELIFKPFEQVDHSQRQIYEGTGLGLALIREMVNLHGGCIQVGSTGPNKGSTFRFIIPVCTQQKFDDVTV